MIDPGHWVALAVSFVAAVTDGRTGRIPNWLTFPAIIVAPIYYGWRGGPKWALFSVLGVLLVSIGPVVAFNAKGMKGGDVKLYAAVGAWLWPELGLFALLSSSCVATLVAALRFARQGRGILKNLGRILTNPFVSKRKQKEVTIDKKTQFRLGPYIFIGVALVVLFPLYSS